MEQKTPLDGRRQRRRYLSAQKKFEIVMEAVQEKTPTADILRREGIYASDLSRFRKLVQEGAIQKLEESTRRGPSPELKRAAVFEEEIRQKDELIAQISMERMILSKKVNGE